MSRKNLISFPYARASEISLGAGDVFFGAHCNVQEQRIVQDKGDKERNIFPRDIYL